VRFWWIKANRPEVLKNVGNTHTEMLEGVG
jgi:hypothetical protein